MLACFEWIAESDVISGLVFPVVVGITVGVAAFVATRKLDDWKERKRQSMLGVAVCDGLLEEIRKGIEIINHVQAVRVSGREMQKVGSLHSRSWSGMNTISDEMLIRLLCLSSGEPVQKFPVRQIRTHLKNYFDHMCPSFDVVTKAINDGKAWHHAAGLLLDGGEYLESAEGVSDMVLRAKMLLNKNSNRWFPK